MEALAIAAVALVGLWCLVVLPAVWLSGTMSQEEEREPSTNADAHEFTNTEPDAGRRGES